MYTCCSSKCYILCFQSILKEKKEDPKRKSTDSEQKSPTSPVKSPDKKNVKSKIGSLDNARYSPGGGAVKIPTQKIDLSNVTSKCGSKNNMTYTPRGGEKKVCC